MSSAVALGGLAVSSDVDAGEWIVKNTHDWGVVHELVPDGFEAYARVFHAAYEWVDDREEAGDYGFRWAGEQPGLWDRAPSLGTLSLHETTRLCEVLAGYTATPERCWFGIWEGYGTLPDGLKELIAPRLHMRGREMILLGGPLSALPATSFDDAWYRSDHANPADRYRSPSLWWPDDRSWCVASDVDLQTSYLGATRECVQRLIDDGQLEIMEVSPEASVTKDADTINPEPLGEYTG